MEHVIERASKGGRARAAALTPEERTESARNAVRARWAKLPTFIAMTASVGMPEKPETMQIETTYVDQDEPLIEAEDRSSWSANSHLSVTMPNSQEESCTQ